VIPIHVVATDILSGETVVLSKGSTTQAILASTAIPAAFAPVQFERLYLADGAISSNTPVKVAVALGAQRLIILPTGYACARQSPPAGAMANALHALTLLIARQLISELESLDPKIDDFVLPPLCPLGDRPTISLRRASSSNARPKAPMHGSPVEVLTGRESTRSWACTSTATDPMAKGQRRSKSAFGPKRTSLLYPWVITSGHVCCVGKIRGCDKLMRL
jgi:predicted acylesterase/phospholipase RssA